jgi:hypothetical protein
MHVSCRRTKQATHCLIVCHTFEAEGREFESPRARQKLKAQRESLDKRISTAARADGIPMKVWSEISERAVVVYGVTLRDALRMLAQEYRTGPQTGEITLAADRVLDPLPTDVQIAIMLGWMKAAILVNEAIHRRPS